MSSISANECGTEWWCPVVSFFITNEAVLRWGVLLAFSAWALRFEWIQYQRSRALVRLIRPRLAESTELDVDFKRVAPVGLAIVVAFAAQFIPFSTPEGVTDPPGSRWMLATITCAFLSLFAHNSNPVALFIKDSTGRRFHVSCASVDGPFVVRKPGRERDKGVATFDGLIEFLTKPKSN